MSAGVKIVIGKPALWVVFLAALFLSVMVIVTGPTPAHAVPSTWQPWSGGLSSSPDSVWIFPTTQDVFVRGNDNQLWHRGGSHGSPVDVWAPLGGILTSGPAAAYPYGTTDQMDVFARGGDGALWWKHYQFIGGWGPWQPLGGIITSDPDAIGVPGFIFVCARGADNALWYRYSNGVVWTPWDSVGGVLTSSPGAAYDWDDDEVILSARGSDNALWVWTSPGGWESVGGTLASGPDASYDGQRVVVAALGTDNAVWYTTSDISPVWATLGGQGTSDPSLAGSQGGAVTGVTYAFVRGTDGQLWETEVP